MKRKKESYFWTSYSDLMTSLFFIMLVLFVLTVVLLNKRMQATVEELNSIKEITSSTQDLDGDYFEFKDEYQKFVLKVNCNFPVDKYVIESLSAENLKRLEDAGNEINRFLENHSKNQYLLIVEGQASKDSPDLTWHNYELSFHRAISLITYWKSNCNLALRDNCEVQIAGSGDGTYNVNSMRDSIEANNQRFLIYILPKNIIYEAEKQSGSDNTNSN